MRQTEVFVLLQNACHSLNISVSSLTAEEHNGGFRLSISANEAADYVMVARILPREQCIKFITTAFSRVDETGFLDALKFVAQTNQNRFDSYLAIDQDSRELRLYRNISYLNADDVFSFQRTLGIVMENISRDFERLLPSILEYSNNDLCEGRDSEEDACESYVSEDEDYSCASSVFSQDIDSISEMGSSDEEESGYRVGGENGIVMHSDATHAEPTSLLKAVIASLDEHIFCIVSIDETNNGVLVKRARSLKPSMLLSIHVEQESNMIEVSSVLQSRVPVHSQDAINAVLESLVDKVMLPSKTYIDFDQERSTIQFMRQLEPSQVNIWHQNACLDDELCTFFEETLECCDEVVSHLNANRHRMTSARLMLNYPISKRSSSAPLINTPSSLIQVPAAASLSSSDTAITGRSRDNDLEFQQCIDEIRRELRI